VAVIGHSLGAAIAVDYLVDEPTAADAVVLLAPLLGISRRRSPLLSPAVWHWLFDHALMFTDLVGMLFTPDLRDREALSLLLTDRFVPRVIYRELMSLVQRNRDRAQLFHLPLFMALGEHDRVIDNQAAERFYQTCAAPIKRLRYQADAGHVLPLDFGWRELTEDVVKFLREQATTEPKR
jgi:alpha-beta hydrolase superfamily lysophospholipase